MEDLKVPVSSSFVSERLKLKSDKGTGESKLHVGSVKKKQEYDDFFNHFSAQNIYQLKKENLVDYLKYTRIEFVAHKCNDYKEVSKAYYDSKVAQVANLADYISLQIVPFTDAKRYYIRADKATKNNFNKFIREIALPKITDIIITKDNHVFTFELVLNDDKVREKESSLIQDNSDDGVDDSDCNDDDNAEANFIAIDKPHQRIFFGAPGTGKSYLLNKEATEYFGNHFERVTFHPNYMYGNFVGSFKPFPKILTTTTGETKCDADGNIQEVITYEYVPGILMQQLVKAYKNPNQNYLLLIEEINRANVASVFGDVFQLLDRTSNGSSEYGIAASKEIQAYLNKEFENVQLSNEVESRLGENYSRLYLPSNFYIWASMNSADQGVMPMDTAFRRRWNFAYVGVNMAADANANEFKAYKFKLGKDREETANWDEFRRAINTKLSSLKIAEDKLLGSYFISKSILETKDLDQITDNIKNKVLMYLYEDAAKPFRNSLFANNKASTYSQLCDSFEQDALGIFNGGIDVTILSNDKVDSEADNSQDNGDLFESADNKPSDV